jgi:ADP-ribose pyrophosphatase YjhB (NUDIX family)
VSREFPARPLVAVAAIVFDGEGRVLVIRRGHPPAQGQFSVPGGAVEVGETLADACVREVREETGLTIEVLGLAEVVERVQREPAGQVRYHYVILDYAARVTGGVLCAGSDAGEARWVTLDELAALDTTEGLAPVLRRAHSQWSGRA